MVFTSQHRDDLVRIIRFVVDQIEEDPENDEDVWPAILRIAAWCAEAVAAKMREIEKSEE